MTIKSPRWNANRKMPVCWVFPGAVYVGYGQHQQGLVCSRKTVSCKSVFVVCVCSELRWFEYIAKQASFRYPIVFVATCLAELIGVNWDYNFVIELMRGSPCLWLLVCFIIIWFWILYLHYSLSAFSVRSVSNIYRTWSLHLSFIIISDGDHHHMIIIIMMHIWR